MLNHLTCYISIHNTYPSLSILIHPYPSHPHIQALFGILASQRHMRQLWTEGFREGLQSGLLGCESMHGAGGLRVACREGGTYGPFFFLFFLVSLPDPKCGPRGSPR